MSDTQLAAPIRVLDAVHVRYPDDHLREHEVGGWLGDHAGHGPSVRGRRAIRVLGQLYPTDPHHAYLWQRFDRVLTPAQAWRIYWTTPDLRACIDSIVRRIATWDHSIGVELDKEDPRFDRALEAAEHVRRFLSAPTKDGMTWQAFLTAFLTDVLVHDAGAAEMVKDGKELLEIVPFRGGYLFPETDDHGFLLEWVQQEEGISLKESVRFKPEDVWYMSLFPNTASPLGVPLVETLLNEVITMLVSGEHTMLAMDADEIPPGLLVLGGLGKTAIRRARQDLEKMRGKDHKIRVISGGEGTKAEWLELRHTPKDLEMADVIKEVQRRIWRCFGVMPVEMGQTDGMPRATAHVQVDVSSSHLITPILEAVQQAINTRIVPLLVDPELVGAVSFQFDRETRYAPKEQLDRAKAMVELVSQGILTRNEARLQVAGAEPIEGGDIATVEIAGILTPVASLGMPPDEEPPEDTEPEGGDQDPGAPDPEDEAPGEVDAEESAHPPGCGCSEHRGLAEIADELPSEWQPSSRFADYRTIDLPALGGVVASYQRAVQPLYRQAAQAVVAIIMSEGRDGIDMMAEARILERVDKELAKLHQDWATRTAPLYRRAAKIGRDSAVEYSGPVLADWEARGEDYAEKAIGYLDDPTGLLTKLRTLTMDAVKSVQGRSIEIRQEDDEDIPAAEQAPKAATLAAGGWANQEHRIANYGGRLVDLANENFRDGMVEAAIGEKPITWYGIWNSVGDKRTCPDCEHEGAQGPRPLSQFTTVPAGAVACMARCRCIITAWTEKEVQDGTAVNLSGNAPGNQPL